MNKDNFKQLIDKYLAGETSLDEERRLRNYFRADDIPNEWKSYAKSFEYFEEMGRQTSPTGIDPFAKIDAGKDKPQIGVADQSSWSNRSLVWSLRVAAGLIFLLIGFSAGQLLQIKEGASSKEVAALNHEIQRMKQTLMYGGSYSQVSAGERLSAINLSTKIPSGDKRLGQEITDILIHTMNSDKSVNVRMAAAEALFRFRDEPGIKKALVNSLSEQEDPQMQITLIDMLVQMKAKGALNEMNKLLMNTNTRDVVKQQLKAGIAELRT